MTPEEKTAQLRCTWAPITDDGSLDLVAARANMVHGIGHVARPGSILRRGRARSRAWHWAAGVDADLPAGSRFGAPLLEALEGGDVAMTDVGRAVRRVLGMKWDTGLVEHPHVDPAKARTTVHCARHRELAGRVAERSLVLLTNDGVLPLGNTIAAIAVIGPNADEPLALLGDYSYQIQADALAQITALASELPALADIADALPPRLSPAPPDPHVHLRRARDHPDGLPRGPQSGAREPGVVRIPGTSVDGGEIYDIGAAVDAARSADVAIVVIGDRSGVLLSGTVGEGRDGASLELPGAQRALVEAVSERVHTDRRRSAEMGARSHWVGSPDRRTRSWRRGSLVRAPPPRSPACSSATRAVEGAGHADLIMPIACLRRLRVREQ